jgi:hypothetical protein
VILIVLNNSCPKQNTFNLIYRIAQSVLNWSFEAGMDLLGVPGGWVVHPLALARGVQGGAILHDKAKK